MERNGITIHIDGKVQGVGFRPYVWQLANGLGLRGDVSNSGEGVIIHLWRKDAEAAIQTFLERLPKDCPPLAQVTSMETAPHHWGNRPADFKIIHSSSGSIKTNIIPDATTCPACLTEMRNPADRRHQYPFINCTHCGPRFSIVERIPYDRANTSMKAFPMCTDCQTEYEDPRNRRFHAQPNACPVCGPHIFLCDGDDILLAEHHDALEQAAQAVLQGGILAMKGLGGFHLVVDATNTQAVERLRQRKNRPSKPLAVMLPDESWLQSCVITPQIKALTHLLKNPAAPIVLVQQQVDSPLSPAIAPGLNKVGVMLPANPLQHLLLDEVKRPLVMTSGNPKGKPPALSNEQALEELQGIADVWLMHDRDIVQRADDSVVRLHEASAPEIEILRRARGYVPDALPLPEGFRDNAAILATGADLKNTFCILRPDHAVMSQHFGDLEDLQIQQQVEQGMALYQNIYQFKPEMVVVDAHPGYVSHKQGRQLAATLQVPAVEVLHHHAHIVACMAEHGLPKNSAAVIGLALDGLGYGENGELWGGECLLVNYAHCTHLGGLPAVALPGSDLASRQPWRNLLAHLQQFIPGWESLSETACIPQENRATLIQAMERGFNAPKASSAGRLFDAVAAALGIVPHALSWEGEAACLLEALAQRSDFNKQKALAQMTPVSMPVVQAQNATKYMLDLGTFWHGWLHWQANPADRAYGFHHALAQGFAQMAKSAAQEHSTNTIVLSGGVLHNALLRHLLLGALESYRVLLPNKLPAGDGGIALGQALIAQAKFY